MAHGQEGLAWPTGPEGAPRAPSWVRARRSFGHWVSTDTMVDTFPGIPILALVNDPFWDGLFYWGTDAQMGAGLDHEIRLDLIHILFFYPGT